MVSSESVGVPTAQPPRLCSPTMSCNGVTSIGSVDMPTTTNFPLGARPSINSDMAFELGAVARMACAPPSFCNSWAALVNCASMYTTAPSFFASEAFSGPRPIAATSSALFLLLLTAWIPTIESKNPSTSSCDYIRMPTPPGPSKLWLLNDHRLGKKGVGHDDYRHLTGQYSK